MTACVAALVDNGGMGAFQRLGGRALIALDGTKYFCSQKLGCPNCQTSLRANGNVESYHSILAATLVAPGHNMVPPLMPEFIVKPDGAQKQDCERNAKRWLGAHGDRVKRLRPIFLGDDLFACQPICQLIVADGHDFRLTAKPESHKALYNFMSGAEIDEMSVTRKEGCKKLTYRYRWFKAAPRREGKDALDVNWIGLTLLDAKGKQTYDGAWVTSLKVGHENVAEIAACARITSNILAQSFSDWVGSADGFGPRGAGRMSGIGSLRRQGSLQFARSKALTSGSPSSREVSRHVSFVCS